MNTTARPDQVSEWFALVQEWESETATLNDARAGGGDAGSVAEAEARIESLKARLDDIVRNGRNDRKSDGNVLRVATVETGVMKAGRPRKGTKDRRS